MTKENKKTWYILGFWVFAAYFFIAARPVPEETVLNPRWITSLESNYPVSLGGGSESGGAELLPFTLGDHYGYLADDGKFTINNTRSGYVSLSEKLWTEYDAYPSALKIMNTRNEPVFDIENVKGYPLFLDDRVFIVGSEQNSLTAIGSRGEELWTHDFPAPLTCIDASGGYIAAGMLDGSVGLLDDKGVPVFAPFEPGGSRLSVILGCAISRDTARLAVISGIDEQRFLLLEKSGDGYKVIYHEFLGEGFRRPVHVSFVDNDSRVAYERQGGLGIYDIGSRTGARLPLEGEIVTLDNSGDEQFLFAVTSQGTTDKRFVVIRYPGIIMIEAPFRSDTAFFARRGGKIYLGGDSTMASFELEKK